MRPGFFFDAMVVRGLEPDDLYSVTADSETVEDAAKKHLYTVPEYVLSIMRRKPGSQELTPVRVVTFNRDDLLPYQQDIYDNRGQPGDPGQLCGLPGIRFGHLSFQGHIKRPMEEYQIVLTVDKSDGEYDADGRPVRGEDSRGGPRLRSWNSGAGRARPRKKLSLERRPADRGTGRNRRGYRPSWNTRLKFGFSPARGVPRRPVLGVTIAGIGGEGKAGRNQSLGHAESLGQGAHCRGRGQVLLHPALMRFICLAFLPEYFRRRRPSASQRDRARIGGSGSRSRQRSSTGRDPPSPQLH